MAVGKLRITFRRFDYRKLWALMPVVLVSYVVWVNLTPSGSVEEFLIDVGADDTAGNARLTGPFDRVSDPATMGELTYRNLTSSVVYFVLEYPFSDRASEVEVSIGFKDTLLKNEVLSIGARNGEGWSYDWNVVYGKFLENKTVFSQLPENVPIGSLVATDLNMRPKENLLVEASNKTLVIDALLRGTHSAYVYVKDTLYLTVSKRDLNRYDGEDVLRVSVYRVGNLIYNVTIPDDGIENSSKELGRDQICPIFLPNLEEGVYKIVFENDADLFMDRIQVYPAKFVFEGNVFSIGTNSSIYFGAESETRLYFVLPSKRTVKFLTYHDIAYQNLTLNNERIEVSKVHSPIQRELEKGSYELLMPKSDIIVQGDVYFSFTEDSYFDPFEYRVISMDYRGVEGADYIISNIRFERHYEWIIAQTSWDLTDIYVEDDKIGFAISVPFSKGDRTMPLDWIRIKVVKNPLV